MSALVVVKTKRQQLGELIAFNRNELGMSKHSLADKTRVPSKDVDRWERGELCPQLQEWQRMRAVFPKLNAAGNPWRALFEEAAAEQRALEQAKEPSPSPTDPRSAAVEIDAAVRMLLEAMPGLRSLSIEIGEDGEASVSYRTREVRIVEDTGSLHVRMR